MPGNHQQGLNAAKTIKERYGPDFYIKIGAIGGKKGTTGGFAANRELARVAGAKGGRISKRRSIRETDKTERVYKSHQNNGLFHRWRRHGS